MAPTLPIYEILDPNANASPLSGAAQAVGAPAARAAGGSGNTGGAGSLRGRTAEAVRLVELEEQVWGRQVAFGVAENEEQVGGGKEEEQVGEAERPRSEWEDLSGMLRRRRARRAAGPEVEAAGGLVVRQAARVEGRGRIAARGLRSPNDTQKVTIGVIGAYAVLIVLVNALPYVKWLLYPFKMLTIAFHEFGHAAVGRCTGARIKSIKLDPREGGVTMMAGGWDALSLPAGYLGSSLIGAVLVFCGFDVVASKIMSFVLGVCWLVTLWWARRDWLTIVTVLFAVGMLVGFWFIEHAEALRFYVLFMGTMSSLYSTFDIYDDLIARKVEESDASVFSKRYGGSSACWGVLWAVVSLGFLAAAIVAGIAAFPETFAQQNASDFLPTRH